MSGLIPHGAMQRFRSRESSLGAASAKKPFRGLSIYKGYCFRALHIFSVIGLHYQLTSISSCPNFISVDQLRQLRYCIRFPTPSSGLGTTPLCVRFISVNDDEIAGPVKETAKCRSCRSSSRNKLVNVIKWVQLH